MNYGLIKDVLDLVQEFELENKLAIENQSNIESFKIWMIRKYQSIINEMEVYWEGKIVGRTAESAIASLVVHMNRFGKNYFKSAIHGSDFSTPDDVIYLIVLKFSYNMTKMDLIKKNVHEKPAGMQIIKRLITNGWVSEKKSDEDKRSKIISITPKGLTALASVMEKVRDATDIVSGDLADEEKIELIRILNKLNDFHQPIYDRNIKTDNLLREALKNIKR
ncbi:MAG: MarR family winged helix-turn-helix transcriptional regulator [Bacteroidetes bacterium]|nr:MarR family winged helix-turn-helix transcriptional regulator [Bacteroidota bacterium]